MEGVLVLQDGKVFNGALFGWQEQTAGEVVFNTSMTGYQEILTDPSYAGQIVVMTYPLIGNYGINSEDEESFKPHVKGFVIRELCEFPSNWRCKKTLEEYMYENRIVGIQGIDTRALTRHLRTNGAMKGIITHKKNDMETILQNLKKPLDMKNLIFEVSTKNIYKVKGNGPRVVLIDLGVKQNIIRSLSKLGCEVIVVPPKITAEKILKLNPDGVLISNGPGDPKDAKEVINTVKILIGRKPIFGICLGHQILALALGADTYKLKFGHRGANHPVLDLESNRVYITSQNHGYAVDEESIKATDIEITHINLNDGTVEGIKHKFLPVFSLQYHPEAAPGPDDSNFMFYEFLKIMNKESARAS
ncbi:MAG: carbamoyl-phosphate synthase small subunit [Thermosediminibacterales bacterium]|nr:carbamoyl-phosphate synthase small subunit [Thermosediminibacterales bacterium]